MQFAVRWLGALLTVLLLFTSSAIAQDTSPAERALAVYAEGKRLYDAGDYAAARAKFIAAIKVEPENPRWYYNLGLAHRQMDNFQAARQALLRARELNPDYKRAEIEQKLVSMGFDPVTSTEVALPSRQAQRAGDDDEADGPPGWLLALGVGAGAIVTVLIWRVRRRSRSIQGDLGKSGAKPSSTSVSPEKLAAAGKRLEAAGGQLVQVEHAMRLGENADLRSQLDHATRSEQSARKQLGMAEQGDAHALRKLGKTLDTLEPSVARAREIATDAFGAAAFSGQGERVACYFCARPLANADYRRLVGMKQAATAVDVIACPECAGIAAQGQAPAVLTGPDGRTHWSELSGFDPYAARHAASDPNSRIPAWQFTPQRSWGELALLAGGAALAGGALAAMLRPEAQASSSLLDLDAAREADLAHEAARTAAQHAAGQRRESFTDHS
jgi:hypothetical protein